MRLDLDFAHPRPRPAPLGWALLGLGLLAAAWAGWRYEQVAGENASLQARVATLTPQAKARKTVTPSTRPVGSVAATQQLLAADWGGLLVELETARPEKRIALLNLDAEPGRGNLGITAEAIDHAAMLAWMDALEALPSLEKVALVSHANQEREGEKPVRFTLKARWLSTPRLQAGDTGRQP